MNYSWKLPSGDSVSTEDGPEQLAAALSEVQSEIDDWTETANEIEEALDGVGGDR